MLNESQVRSLKDILRVWVKLMLRSIHINVNTYLIRCMMGFLKCQQCKLDCNNNKRANMKDKDTRNKRKKFIH